MRLGAGEQGAEMADPPQTIIATRAAQMFPTLNAAEVERLRRFGEVRSFAKGEALVQGR